MRQSSELVRKKEKSAFEKRLGKLANALQRPKAVAQPESPKLFKAENDPAKRSESEA